MENLGYLKYSADLISVLCMELSSAQERIAELEAMVKGLNEKLCEYGD